MARTIQFDNSVAGRYEACRDCLLCGKKGKKKCLTRKYVGFEDIQITHLRDTGKCRAYIGK